MIISSATLGSDWFLNGITQLQAQQTKTEKELSSGYRIQDAADAPDQAAALVSLGANLATAQTYQKNLVRVQTEYSAADSALSASLTIIDSARSLATQGASTLAADSTRQALAVQVQNLQQELVGQANTVVGGQYIFGGDQDTSPPYQYNAASATGVDTLTTPTSNRVITDTNGQPIYSPETASTVFDHQTGTPPAPAADNAFAALQQLYTALQANDQTGIGNALNSLRQVSDWLNAQQSKYGAGGQRIAAEQNNNNNQITNLQSQISAIRDTDMVKSATDLASETTAQSAAFGAQAQIPHKSLFDYLG